PQSACAMIDVGYWPILLQKSAMTGCCGFALLGRADEVIRQLVTTSVLLRSASIWLRAFFRFSTAIAFACNSGQDEFVPCRAALLLQRFIGNLWASLAEAVPRPLSRLVEGITMPARHSEAGHATTGFFWFRMWSGSCLAVPRIRSVSRETHIHWYSAQRFASRVGSHTRRLSQQSRRCWLHRR